MYEYMNKIFPSKFYKIYKRTDIRPGYLYMIAIFINAIIIYNIEVAIII